MLRKCKFYTKNCNDAFKQTAQNSALRKWKFGTQEMEILPWRMDILHSENGNFFSQCHGRALFCKFFRAKSGNSVRFWAVVFKSKFCATFRDCGIAKSWRDWLMEGHFKCWITFKSLKVKIKVTDIVSAHTHLPYSLHRWWRQSGSQKKERYTPYTGYVQFLMRCWFHL